MSRARTIHRRTQSLTLLLLISFGSVAWGNDQYDVGVAAVDITPSYPIRLNGFGNRREESEGVSQPIYAKALAIRERPAQGRSKAAPLVLVTLDSLGIRQTMLAEVARRLEKSHQLPAQNLVITFTHSHCTPKVNGACDNIFSQAIPADHQQHIDRYTKELTDNVFLAAQQALDSMKPAHLEWAVGAVKFAKNRRVVGGPIDHDLPMLVVRDAKSQKPRAIYVSYACHCVTLSFNRISGDWAGYAAQMIQRRQPGVVAMVSIGAGSDQNPVSGVTGDKVQVAEAQGAEIANEVERLLAGKLKRITGSPRSVRRQIALPLNKLPTREQLVEQTGKGRPTDRHNAKTQLQRLDRGEPLLSQIDYPIQTWTFGDSLCMTFLAGEVCVDYATRLKRELDRERFWLNAYCNDFCSYIPSERLVAEGGYGGGAEVPYFALPATLKGGLEQKIVDEVRRQAPKSFHVAAGTQGIAPKSPDESIKCMQTSAKLQVVLAAAEPNVTDPVAIDFGPDGRLWVAEMNDYGRDVYESFPQSGRIRWLRDRDNDGYFEDAKTFVSGLRFPTDVKVWRDGILICDAPHILFARDENGDGEADSVTKLFSGFEVRNAQARVNSLRFGLDNWIYGASGLFGGQIKSEKTGKIVNCSNRDFRMNPDTGVLEPVGGRTQQGRCRNDWGDWFGCSNGTLLRFIPSADDYDLRNPFASPGAPPVLVTNSEAHRLYPPQDLVTFELSGAPGRATSACGLGIYRDTLLGRDFLNDAFTCEPVHQSVHRIDFRTTTNGFLGSRGPSEESREFLSSTDRWFRPVQARTGPDGALWVVDMYRYVIEHSRWIPQKTLAELDIYAGQGRGRIYRILPRQTDNSAEADEPNEPAQLSPLIPNLELLSDAALAAKIDSSNGAMRDLAHQMLLWRGAAGAAPTLRKIAAESQHPAARIQALSALNGLVSISQEELLSAVQSQHSELQRFAVQLSEPLLDHSNALLTTVIALASSKDMRLRRQVALSLGACKDIAAAKTIAHLLSANEADAHVRSAALNSVTGSNVSSVMREFSKLRHASKNQATWRRLIVLSIQTGDRATLDEALAELLSPNESPSGTVTPLWLAVLNALDARAAANRLPSGFNNHESVRQRFASALTTVQADDRSDGEYLAAIELLGRPFGGYSQSAVADTEFATQLSAQSRATALGRFMSPRFSTSIQGAAIRAVSATGAAGSEALLLQAYGSLNSELRLVIVDQLLSQKRGPLSLVTAIEEGRVRANMLDAGRRAKLLSSADTQVRTAAKRVFAASHSNPAGVVLASREALRISGSASQGREVFRKRCSSCHRLEDHGHMVGPDLGALTNRDPLWLLTAMLDPNKDVDARYLSWTAITNDGRSATGMIVAETSTEIRLREAGGKEHHIVRTDLEEFKSTQKSVMPEGLERDMSVRDLSHVIAYLASLESPPKQLSGNTPTVVTAGADGLLKLTAATAEIRGSDITFETPFANIGYWHHQGDSATWRIDLSQAGEFDIYIDASCSSQAAGNEFQIAGLPDSLRGAVASTGGWDQYRQRRIGTTKLPAGRTVITLQAASPVKLALFDLKEIRLAPKGQAPNFVSAKMENAPLPRYPAAIATFLLDESQSVERRQQAIDQRPGMGPTILGLLVSDLNTSDEAEEYRRIPWIWRVAIAVAKRNDGGEIRDVLEVSVPKRGQPLRDWQAVVIGGGLINGATQRGLWPDERLNEILAGIPQVKAAWPEALRKSAKLADNKTIRPGTRYDALRMVALDDQHRATTQLSRYLQEDAPRELQMGSVSGLADIESTAATTALSGALAYLKNRNRQLAIEGLLRTDQRTKALEELIKAGKLVLSAKEKQTLREHPSEAIRKRFKSLDSPPAK